MTKLLFRTGCFVALVGVVAIVLFDALPAYPLMYVHSFLTGLPMPEYFVAGPELVAYLDSLLLIPLGLLAAGLLMASAGLCLRRRTARGQ